jgi:hypothetical protein
MTPPPAEGFARSETSHESRIGHKAELTCIIESFAVRGCCCFRVGTANVAVIVGVAIDICRNGFAGDVRIGGELAARVFYVKRELVDFVVVDAFDDILRGKFSQLSGLVRMRDGQSPQSRHRLANLDHESNRLAT